MIFSRDSLDDATEDEWNRWGAKWMSKQTTGKVSQSSRQDSSQTTKESSVTTPPNESQVGGKHYKRCSIQPWDYTIANDLDYFQGSIIKYVTRWKDKGGVEDLHKARHFLDKYIETMEEKYKGMKERPGG